MKNFLPFILAVSGTLLLFGACNSAKNVVGYNPTKKSYHESPNKEDRKAGFVLLHHTACDFDTAYMLLATSYGKVSSHYLIDRDGAILQLVDERMRAYHAGASSWFSLNDLNSATIGIEIVNNGSEPFPNQQIDSVMKLLTDLKHRYKFSARNFIGHLDIAPGRKVDPSAFFPWKRLAEAGFSLWYDEAEAKRMSEDATVVKGLRDPLVSLMLLGYNIRKPNITFESFKQHYTVSDKSGKLSDYDKCVLQLLANKVIEEAKQN